MLGPQSIQSITKTRCGVECLVLELRVPVGVSYIHCMLGATSRKCEMRIK